MAAITDDVKPLDVDGVNAAIAGTVAFVIGLIVTVVFRDNLAASNSQWWIWVCVAGATMGLLGVAYTTRRRAAYRAAGRVTR